MSGVGEEVQNTHEGNVRVSGTEEEEAEVDKTLAEKIEEGGDMQDEDDGNEGEEEGEGDLTENEEKDEHEGEEGDNPGGSENKTEETNDGNDNKEEEANVNKERVSIEETLDSEILKEIDQEKIHNNRNLIQIRFSRKRKHFGRMMQHTVVNAPDTHKFFVSYTDPRFIDLRRERDYGVVTNQNMTELRNVSIQTSWQRMINNSSQTNAAESQSDEMIIAEKKVNEEALKLSLNRTSAIIEESLTQNTSLQLFKDDFEELPRDETIVSRKVDIHLKEHQSFTHIEYSKSKRITCVDWQPKARGVIAFSCIDVRPFEERLDNVGKTLTSYVVIWNFSDPIYPQMVLESPYDVNCIQFNPQHQNLLAGGLINGQVIFWDLDSYVPQKTALDDDKPRDQIPHLSWTQISYPEYGHRCCVNEIHWIPDCNEVSTLDTVLKSSNDQCFQFASIAADGKIIIWDIRIDNVKRAAQKKKNEKLKDAWIPHTIFPLIHPENMKDISSHSFVIGDKETNPYSIVLATQDGQFAIADWTPQEKESSMDDPVPQPKKALSTIVKHVYGPDQGGHCGVAYKVNRHPSFKDIFLTIGDCSFKIWKHDKQKPIWTSPYSESAMLCGRWSPTRPGVAFIARKDGCIEVWDFMDKSHEPSIITSITQAPITSMEFRVGTGKSKYQYQFIAIGSEVGTLHIVEVPLNLIRPSNEEMSSVKAFFERETARMLYYTKRWQYHAELVEEMKKNQEISESQKKKASEEKEEEEVNMKELRERFLQKIKFVES